MNLNDCDERIELGMRGLSANWADLSDIWDDAVRDEFERDYVLPLEATVAGVRRALDALSEAVDRVRAATET